ACGEDSPTPTDFEDPAAITANLDAVDSAFNTPAFDAFNAATFYINPTSSGAQPVGALIRGTFPGLERVGATVFLQGARQSRDIQAMVPQLSAATAQGELIPDSLYGRVYEWDASLDEYTFQDSTVSGLNGVRYILYAVGLDGNIVEPVSSIGTLDIIDNSTTSALELQLLVRGPGGTPTYIDYTIGFTSSQTSANASVTGFISNGLSAGDNKTLTFDETFTVNQTGARVNATFTLNNPAITVMLIQTITFDDPDIVIVADFRIIEGGQTVRTLARLTLDTFDSSITVNIVVTVDGHPVASLSGDPTDPGTVWVDAGGEPLTVADLAALDGLFDALEAFGLIVSNLFSPITAFAVL
ncbi:MAG: hypothetical protein Q8Q14_01515, partial [Gemmatimonadales bacterium]|nr:hypothetical protein [Gemmatimonadales bacterium]